MSYLQSVILGLLLRRICLPLEKQHTLRSLWRAREMEPNYRFSDSGFRKHRPTQSEIIDAIETLMSMYPYLIHVRGESRNSAKYYIDLEE